ncbi:16S rRNA (guanine(527)-N(7))-methyltransferase RsmG [Kangiella sp. TOML190]|uniref:16S rRNA (guanine(527)-N(7))-methyltransferase RsmG n=1 Tax=Kangiella sp. TOML190 TaxID=2931351 RepID=UPI00203CEE10|nr:16S rRNA (guanine(527)-N(7))-methyltransferase RsmG [Kangiella sp. TOML190]
MESSLIYLRKDFLDKCTQLGVSVTAEQTDSLLAYLSLLLKWNKGFNLTAITDPKEALDLHLVDSVSISPFIKDFNSLLDVGTGGGLPGIPLAILNPDKQFSLLDTNSKKTRFLKQTVFELGLSNVQVVNSRVQDFAQESGYACILSRAFASIEDMLNWTEHLLAEQGQWLAMKGVYPTEELQQLPQQIQLVNSELIQLPNRSEQRHLIYLQKTNQ